YLFGVCHDYYYYEHLFLPQSVDDATLYSRVGVGVDATFSLDKESSPLPSSDDKSSSSERKSEACRLLLISACSRKNGSR
uniref:Uncharacterized protein n=1 Tax=Ciona intestinalis TaxID=7719 RepID=H2Y353_CIOIN